MERSLPNGGRKRDEPPYKSGKGILSSTNLTLDYTADELEFLKAMDDYKRNHQCPYPTWHEVLAVVKSLGYKK